MIMLLSSLRKIHLVNCLLLKDILLVQDLSLVSKSQFYAVFILQR